jgi:hypothetical protein
MDTSNQAIPERDGNEVFISDFDQLLAFHADELSPAEAETIMGGGRPARAWLRAHQVGEAAFSAVSCLKIKLGCASFHSVGEAG